MKKAVSVSLVWLGLLGLPSVYAETPEPPFLDLGFEAPDCSSGWFMGGQRYDASGVDSGAHSGRRSLRLQYLDSAWTESSRRFGVATQLFPVEAAAGKKLRYSGYLRTEAIANGYAGLWMRIDGAGKTLGFDNMANRGVTGTTPWTRYVVELDVPADAKEIYFGALLVGDGTLWVDSLSFEIDGKPWVEGPTPTFPPPSEPAVAWLRQRAIPFDTSEAGKGFADLQPLKKLIGNARIVSLGEATHGSREFFQMKHRLTEFLATEMGFTLFAIEANMPEAYRVNEYVLTGQGDPKALLKGMYFWTWDTQEVLDMILWMRELNRSGKGRIQFLGFDMQTPTVAIENVKKLVAEADPELSVKIGEIYAPFADYEKALRGGEPKGEVLTAAATRALDLTESVREKLTAKLGKEKAAWAVQNARIPLQMAQMTTGKVSRDESMARNTEWILDQNPNAKIVLWAHNGHVFRNDRAMGGYLAKRYPKEMVVLGFSFHEGRYTAMGNDGQLGQHDAAPAIAGSVESYFHAAGLPRLILDLRDIPPGSPAAAWLSEKKPFRSIGALAMKCAYGKSAVAEEYDALIYFDQTNASQVFPRPPRPAAQGKP